MTVPGAGLYPARAMKRPQRRGRWCVGLAGLLRAAGAMAQTGDVTAAAAAFQEGQRLQLGQEYARAAEMFELADAAAPSPAALRSAIRSHQAAGQRARAASLSLRAQTRDAADPQSVSLATATLAALAPALGRVQVQCAPACTLTLDRRAVAAQPAEQHAFFVEPGERALEVSWGPGRARSRSLNATAGQTVDLVLEAPAEAPPAVPVAPAAPVVPVVPVVVAPVEAPAARGLSPAVFAVGAGLTAVSAGLLVWSGLDTLAARDAYVQSPSEAGYHDGVSLELRTNVLVASTAVLGVTTAVVGMLFTRWGTTRGGRARAVLTPAAGGAGLGVVGCF